MNSTFGGPGRSIRSRRGSAMMSSMSRCDSFFNLTGKSPCWPPVTATIPSCKPVRREGLGLSGAT